MSKTNQKIKKKKDKAFDRVAKSIGDYMKLEGWNIVLIGSPRIEQPLGSLKYNFELIFRFTGGKIRLKRNPLNSYERSSNKKKSG